MIFFQFPILWMGLIACSDPKSSSVEDQPARRIGVFVSIDPQAWVVERVGGSRVAVQSMVQPGQSPATYQPTPRQMVALAEADLYLSIGVPFERAWIGRIAQVSPRIRIVETQRGIEHLLIAQHDHATTGTQSTDRHNEESEAEGLKDPHVWMSPRLLKRIAANTCEALAAVDPTGRTLYEANRKRLDAELDALDREIRRALADLPHRRFMIQHPCLGYFARDYGLEQIPIEIEGKQPTGRRLAELIDRAKAEGIRVVFVQSQFSRRAAETVAAAVGGRVEAVDPLARDLPANLLHIAKIIARGDSPQSEDPS